MKNKLLLKILVAVLGAAGGLLYQRNIGCTSGGCPITSDPWVSTLYGAVLGWLFGGILTDAFTGKATEQPGRDA